MQYLEGLIGGPEPQEEMDKFQNLELSRDH